MNYVIVRSRKDSEAKEPKLDLVHFDKKQFTERGAELLTSKKINELKMLPVEELSVYNSIMNIETPLTPDWFVVSFPDDHRTARNDKVRRCRLLSKLANGWHTYNQSFDMTRIFPGYGTHVVVEIMMTPELEKDRALLRGTLKGCGRKRVGSQPSKTSQDDDEDGLQQPLPRNIIYHRGYIIKVHPGCDVYSASYEVFLYDCGIFADGISLERIKLLTDKQRLLYTPAYKMLRVPGLSPLANNFVLENLHEKPKQKLIKVGDWPPSTEKYAAEFLRSHGLQVILFAEHGLFLYGDIRVVQYLDSKNKTVNMEDFQDREKHELYTEHLVKKELTSYNKALVQNLLLLDAEDEESLDWVEAAKIPDY